MRGFRFAGIRFFPVMLMIGVLLLGLAGISVFWLGKSEQFDDDPERCQMRSSQMIGRWDSPPDALRGAQFSWIFTEDGQYEFKQDFRRPPNALTWYYTEDKGKWKVTGVKDNRVRLQLDPGTFNSVIVFELPGDLQSQPKEIHWLKYSEIDYQLRTYPLQATAVDDDSWRN